MPMTTQACLSCPQISYEETSNGAGRYRIPTSHKIILEQLFEIPPIQIDDRPAEFSVVVIVNNPRIRAGGSSVLISEIQVPDGTLTGFSLRIFPQQGNDSRIEFFISIRSHLNNAILIPKIVKALSIRRIELLA